MEYPQGISARHVRQVFQGAADLTARPVRLGGAEATLFFLDGLTAGAEIADFILHPATQRLRGSPREMLEACLQGQVYAAVAKDVEDLPTLCQLLVNGFAALVFEDFPKAVAFEAKSAVRRLPAPPTVEHTVKGAKDAFTETARTNTTLTRCHLRSPFLRITELTVGTKSRTNVSLVWLEGVTPRRIVTQLERRLRGLDVESFVTPAAVEEAVTGSRCSPFPLLRFTERPDKFAQALLEGQAGLLVDGLPLGYLAPVELGGFLTSPEDQGMDFVTASCIRVIRYGALLVSLLLPALYAAMAAFHQEMLPTQLLLSIIESKQQVPFPTMLEVIGLLIAFEILQEAGVHLPQSLGQAVSIIGGLVVGSAAVEAKLISPAALIVVAVAGVCGYVIPGRELANAVRVWRFLLTLCAALAGLFGVSVGLIALLLHLGGLETFGLSYLRPFDRAASDGMVLRRRLKTQAARRQQQNKQRDGRSL